MNEQDAGPNFNKLKVISSTYLINYMRMNQAEKVGPL